MPHAAARTGVPVGAAMSIPSWLRPQRGPKGDVTVPCTGLAIVDDPQAWPLGAGAEVGVVVPVVFFFPPPVVPGDPLPALR